MLSPLSLAAIIDDDEVHVFVVELLMHTCRFAEQIIPFTNGKKALKFLSAGNHTARQLPDVIFLDIDMPVMDAWGFLDEFKKIRNKLNKKIPIYILTTSIYRHDRKKAASYPGVKGYFIKPLKREDLAKVAKEMASNKNPN